jgi:hypothetical protein
MIEAPRIAPPVGRIRYCIGLVILAVGAALLARVTWLGAFRGSEFRFDDWIRFWFFLCLGFELTLIGCWMSFRSMLALWTAILVVVGLAIVLSISTYINGF